MKHWFGLSSLVRVQWLSTLIVATALLLSPAQGSTFSLLPESGTVTAVPGMPVGWGYSITNDSSLYLLPTGLDLTGVSFGTLTDIFDYPVVAPNSTVSLSYLFSAPGGPGASIGMIEYLPPADLPVGSIQSGTATLKFLLFEGNPDLEPDQAPVGGEQSFSPVAYEINAISDVPEPGTVALICVGFTAVWLGRRRK